MLHKSKLNPWFTGILGCVLLGAANAGAQKLSASPRESQMDERLQIKITGLRAAQPVIVRASVTDSDGRLWQSYAGFYADAKGTVDLTKRAPANGTYTGIDAWV